MPSSMPQGHGSSALYTAALCISSVLLVAGALVLLGPVGFRITAPVFLLALFPPGSLTSQGDGGRSSGATHHRLCEVTPSQLSFPELDQFVVWRDTHSNTHLTTLCQPSPAIEVRSMQVLLQRCLGWRGCTGVLWRPATGASHLCQGHLGADTPSSSPLPESTQRPGGIGDCVYVAGRKQRAQHAVNGSGLHVLPAPSVLPRLTCLYARTDHRLGNASVDSSQGLWDCSVLPSASTLPLFDLRAQAEVSRLFDPGQHMRGFNPSLVEYNGTVFHVLRACNYTKCPPHVGLHFGRDQLALPVETKVLICPSDTGQLPASCWVVPLVDGLFSSPPNTGPSPPLHPLYRGLEDARAFVWRGRVHLLGTVTMGGSGVKLPRVGLVRLTPDLRGAEGGRVLRCRQPTLLGSAAAAGEGGNFPEKNYMPLVLDEQLYVVTATAPLSLAWVHPETLECEGGVGVAHPQYLSFDAIRPPGSLMSGGTPFVPLGHHRYLALTHHYRDRRRDKVYYHHFLVLEAQEGGGGRHDFTLAWLSEGFRLPSAGGPEEGVQFATGLLLRGGVLHVSYGSADCFAALAVLRDAARLLPLWEAWGIGASVAPGSGV